MSCYEKISCRVAIQVCIGHFPDGRERHRTFSMRGVNPDASPESIAAVVRALAPVLAYPITKVRKVVKRRVIIYEEGVVPWDDAEPVTYAGRIVPFPSGRTQRQRANTVRPYIARYRRGGNLPPVPLLQRIRLPRQIFHV